jgi:hypothetical protein
LAWDYRASRIATAGVSEDPAALLADAISERSLTGARDVTAVIDARIRRRTTGLVPHAPLPGANHPVTAWPR